MIYDEICFIDREIANFSYEKNDKFRSLTEWLNEIFGEGNYEFKKSKLGGLALDF